MLAQANQAAAGRPLASSAKGLQLREPHRGGSAGGPSGRPSLVSLQARARRPITGTMSVPSALARISQIQALLSPYAARLPP